jgi:hypothetical protein
VEEKMGIRIRAKRTFIGALAMLLGVALIAPAMVYAEGTHQMNDMQVLDGRTQIYADVLNGGETINISLSEDTFIQIFDESDTLVDSVEFTANLDREAALPSPITSGVHKFTPETIGTFRIDLGEDYSFERYDISVTSTNSTNPDPTANGGRIWSYLWYL